MNNLNEKLKQLLQTTNHIIVKDDNQDLIKAGLDSIEVIKLILAVEKEFNMKFSDEDLQMKYFQTFNSLYDFLDVKLK